VSRPAYRGSEADPFIEVLHAVAADPERWESLVSALADAPVEPPPGADMAALEEDRPAGPVLGVLLLSADGEVLGANPVGETLLRARLGEPGKGGGGRLAAANREALSDAGRRLAEVGSGQVIVRLDQADDDDPRFAYVGRPDSLSPAIREGIHPTALGRAALAAIFPAPENTDRLWQSVRQSFGLTSAETRLAARLKAGRTLKEAAEDLGVSLNTVRNQLRAVFDKMGLSRQSELVQALAQLSALSSSLQSDAPVLLPAEDGGAPPLQFHRLADGRVLAYRVYGAPGRRDAMVFHQGIGSSLLPRGSEARARALGVRIVCAERPGVGRSDPDPRLSLASVAADMVALSRALDLRRVRVAGMMYGAAFALSYAEALGLDAEGVLIVSGRPTGAPLERTEDRPHPTVLFRRRMLRLNWVAEPIYALLRRRLSRAQVARMVTTAASTRCDADYLAHDPSVIDFVHAYMSESLSRGSRGAARETTLLAGLDHPAWPDLRAPVVVWHGVEDPLAGASDVAAWLGRPPEEIRLVPGIGHFLPHKHWAEIMAWLAGEDPI